MNKIGIDFGTTGKAAWINPLTGLPEAISFIDSANFKFAINYNKGCETFSEEALKEIFSKIYRSASVTCFNQQTIEESTITHSLFFSDEQKTAMRSAAINAGFLNVRLIPEVVASVVYAHYFTPSSDTGYLVYNFGETSFEASFIKVDQNGNYTAPIGYVHLTDCGGQDIDKRIYQLWDQLAKAKYNRGILTENENYDSGFLARCRQQKEILSIFIEHSFNEVLPPPGFHRLEWKTTRQEFEKLISPIIDKTIDKTNQFVQRIYKAGYKIDQVILIGGSSAIPIVLERIKQILPDNFNYFFQPEYAISMGAVVFPVEEDETNSQHYLSDNYSDNGKTMNKIGIDFGTTFSTASWINPKTKQPEAINFHDIGVPKMPSVVYYGPDGVMVGLAAYNQLENSSSMKPEQRNQVIQSVVQSIKRDMKQGQFFYINGGGKVSHEEIVAAILRKVKEQAEITCFNSQAVEEATITHPVVFAAWQKEMLRKAATMAGFKKVNLLEEPVAAALGYASTTNEKVRNILVYDFGGGTFDVAYVQYDNENQYRVPVEPEGDFNCGGDDVDVALYDRWEQLAKQQYNRTIDINPNNLDIGFKSRCRKHKEQMSLFPKYTFSEVLPPPGFHRVEMELARPEYDRLAEPIIARTIAKTERLLRKVKEAGHTIDTAIMIGGSSRIPMVYDRLKQILPVEPRRVMQVDVAVALGAVIYNPNGKQVRNEQVYCIHCGFKQPNTNRFCIKCGSRMIGFVEN